MAQETKQPVKKRDRTGDNLRGMGFDETKYNRESGYWRPRCSQCEVLVIQGVACHENGCPNQRRSRDSDD